MAKIDELQIKRGPEATTPQLKDGEMGLARDTHQVFIGNNGKNIPVRHNLIKNQRDAKILSFVFAIDAEGDLAYDIVEEK